jgi:anaerobic magnesium-protoporphyrin IX monomethyl ester cyclase
MNILLVVYDNGSYIHWLPIGLAHIAAVLKRAGHSVSIYNQDMNHYPEIHLTQYLNENRFDMVGVSIIGGYYQYRKLLKISAAINAAQQRPYYVIGGHGPSPDPDYFLKKTQADAVIIGEGEHTILELLDNLERPEQLDEVLGIAWREGDQIRQNNRRPLIADVDSIPFPAYELFPIEYYRLLRMPHTSNNDMVMPMLSGRGCTFKCNFCYRLDEGFRPRSSEGILEEIRLLQRQYGITHIAFGDELLMSSTKRTEELCEAFLGSGLKFTWNCNGRLNFAKPKLLRLMKQAGCVFINYGIEAMDDQVLKNMNKALTTDMVIKGIEATLGAGISPGFNIIFGNIGESQASLDKGVEFLLKYDDGSQIRTIRPVTPYPGSPLYYYAIEKGLLRDCEDFYENKHVNSDLLSVNFTNMSDDDVHCALLEANSRLIQNYFNKKMKDVIKQAETLYLGHNAEFRGFRQN